MSRNVLVDENDDEFPMDDCRAKSDQTCGGGGVTCFN
jgi:hypothetical protein